MTQTATNIDPYITAAKRELTEGKDISKLFSGVRDTSRQYQANQTARVRHHPQCVLYTTGTGLE